MLSMALCLYIDKNTALFPSAISSQMLCHLSFPVYPNDFHSFFSIQFHHCLQKVITGCHTPLLLCSQPLNLLLFFPSRLQITLLHHMSGCLLGHALFKGWKRSSSICTCSMWHSWPTWGTKRCLLTWIERTLICPISFMLRIISQSH